MAKSLTKTTRTVLSSPFFVGLALVRIIQPLFIFSYPIATTIWQFIIDFVDGDYLEITVNIKKPLYETFDKIMDHWWLSVVMIFLYPTAPDSLLPIFIFLFIYRTLGFIAFMFSAKRWVLLLFPNIFEMLFHFYILAPLFVEVDYTDPLFLIVLMGIIISLAFFREYMLHIKSFDLVNWKAVLTKLWKNTRKFFA